MTRLVVDGRERADTWEHLTGDEAPSDRDFTVGVTRWLAQRRALLEHVERTRQSVGVRLALDTDPAVLAGDLRHFALIVIEIPSSADGRFFSIAARLREHLQYRGELRVDGDVAPDQLLFMRRCGVNAFELGDRIDVESFIRRYRRFYQSSGPGNVADSHIRTARRRLARSQDRPGPENEKSSSRTDRAVTRLGC